MQELETNLKEPGELSLLLRACVERTNDVIIITEAEPLEESGPRIIFVNEAFERQTGYSREEALGRGLCFMPNPKSSRPALDRIRAALKDGRSIREELAKYSKGGQEVCWELEIAPLKDEAGHCTHFIAIERDISERKQTEKALRQSEYRLKKAQRLANIGSWEWNVVRQKVVWSDELYRIFGLEPQSVPITAETFMERIHPEEREIMRRRIDEVRRMPLAFTETFRVIRPSGEVRYVVARGEAVTGSATRPIKIMGTVQDITERKLAEEARLQSAKLEAANRELEAFAYSVSHDLRAPLRTIDGFTRLLVEEYSATLDEGGRSYLDYIQVATRRMSHLIQDLLELSQTSRSEIRRMPVDLSALVETILRELREADPQRQVETIVTPGLVAHADPHLLRIALENLLRNAWKFTGKTAKPRIEFGVKLEGDGPVYFVRDNGAGFDMAYAGKLFGVFQRLHGETEFSGTGVGLATVRRIIARHGGEIHAEAAVNQGATFYFTLPD